MPISALAFGIAKTGFIGLQDFIFFLTEEEQKDHIIRYYLTTFEKETLKLQILVFINIVNYSIISSMYDILVNDLIEYKRNQIINSYYNN